MQEDTFHLGIKAIIRNAKGEILLLKKTPEEVKLDQSKPWDVPGGRIQIGDSVEDTLKRELKEETGITEVQSIRPLSMILTQVRIPTEHGVVGLILSSYLCDVGQTPEVTLSKEHSEYKWASPKEAAQLLEVIYPVEFVEELEKIGVE